MAFILFEQGEASAGAGAEDVCVCVCVCEQCRLQAESTAHVSQSTCFTGLSDDSFERRRKESRCRIM